MLAMLLSVYICDMEISYMAFILDLLSLMN